jgi:hypothetical protein
MLCWLSSTRGAGMRSSDWTHECATALRSCCTALLFQCTRVECCPRCVFDCKSVVDGRAPRGLSEIHITYILSPLTDCIVECSRTIVQGFTVLFCFWILCRPGASVNSFWLRTENFWSTAFHHSFLRQTQAHLFCTQLSALVCARRK